ncbi:Mu transposase C-terminal domain-containing protein [Peribacillus frigoritolerans]|uniref:Mu transposase C-terminal domain-containing protein n=1 Tax=Peribacillus frigoritolerans TaxID=450367 RepID=UPI0020796C7F|nr:Mu transposase C-terminal domain-containing protein [Peribacillus frigoritolerans]USK74789.1 DDE-type integrase/transposase/recombinase [Peribacillus frigoritolerans]
MMTEVELEEWFIKNNIPEHTKELIKEIRLSDPYRKVQSGRGNVSGAYPSKKMGFTIQFESHTVELPAIYEMEYNQSILEYYDQPKPVFMEYLSGSGRKISVNSTPDFFILGEKEAYWEEWKTEEELLKLSIKSPNRYVKDKDDNWRCPPGESFADKFGLRFVLRSSKEINWIFQRNIKLMEEYIKNSYLEEVALEKIKVVKEIVASNFGITIKELLDCNHLLKPEDLYIMVAEDILYADIRKYVLIEHEKVQIFMDKGMADIHNEAFNEVPMQISFTNNRPTGLTQGSKFLWDNQEYTILNFGRSSITAVDETDRLVTLSEQNLRVLLEQKVIKLMNMDELAIDNKESEYKRIILEGASRLDIEEAHKRYEIINNVDCNNQGYSTKTVSRWRKAYEEASKLYGNGFLGLIPKKKERGNRRIKIDTRVVNLISEVISKYYLTTKQINMKAAFELLEEECRKQELTCPSYVTFTKHIGKESSFIKEKERKGRRAAYQLQNWHLEQHTPKHGDLPFEIAHIDHTELDIELVFSNANKKYTQRPYLTLLIDAYSRVILAHYITFDPPSSRSNMMVLRECVRKYNQLPRTIVVDGGKEFHSIYFDSLCAQFEMVKKTRPPAQARFGSVIERLFGTTNTKFIHNLQGNTQLTKEVRKVTKSVNPKNYALWTLPMLDEMFYKWIDYYQSQPHSGLGTTPKEQFEYGMKLGRSRKLNFINYDESFILTTLPPTPRGSGLIQIGKGVVFNNINYWNNDLRAFERQKVDLKYDPFDVGVLYAFVNKRWIKCLSDFHYLLKGKSHKELQMITEEIRYKNKNKKRVTIRDIASFMSSIEENEKVIKQSLKDEENQRIKKDAVQDGYIESNTLIQNEIDISSLPKFVIYEES